jgi:hypothetical protein
MDPAQRGVDEDKGSPSQDGANPGEVQPGENRTISGSPSGAPSPVHLSLRKSTLQQGRAGNRAGKNAKDGNQTVIAGSVRRDETNPLHPWRFVHGALSPPAMTE